MARFKHGMCKTPTYRSWSAMKRRCDNKKIDNYHHYGGRGIKYESRWFYFLFFLEDMGSRPEGTELDRFNNDLGYSKDNCRWTTKAVNNQNRFLNKKSKLPKGVLPYSSGKYQARMRVAGKQHIIGVYNTPEMAEEGYKIMIKEWYGRDS